MSFFKLEIYNFVVIVFFSGEKELIQMFVKIWFTMAEVKFGTLTARVGSKLTLK